MTFRDYLGSNNLIEWSNQLRAILSNGTYATIDNAGNADINNYFVPNPLPDALIGNISATVGGGGLTLLYGMSLAWTNTSLNAVPAPPPSTPPPPQSKQFYCQCFFGCSGADCTLGVTNSTAAEAPPVGTSCSAPPNTFRPPPFPLPPVSPPSPPPTSPIGRKLRLH